MTFIDTNVLLDLLKADPRWAVWSERNLERAAAQGPLAATDVVFAELCVGSPAIEDVDEFLGSVGVSVMSCPKAGLFLAAKAYLATPRTTTTESPLYHRLIRVAHRRRRNSPAPATTSSSSRRKCG